MKRRTLLKSLVGLLGLPVAAKAVYVPTEITEEQLRNRKELWGRILDAQPGDVLTLKNIDSAVAKEEHKLWRNSHSAYS